MCFLQSLVYRQSEAFLIFSLVKICTISNVYWPDFFNWSYRMGNDASPNGFVWYCLRDFFEDNGAANAIAGGLFMVSQLSLVFYSIHSSRNMIQKWFGL